MALSSLKNPNIVVKEKEKEKKKENFVQTVG